MNNTDGLRRQNHVNADYTRIEEQKRIWSAMARKRKKRSPAMRILAFVTTIVLVTTFIYLRGKRHKVQELSQFTNTNISTYQNVYVRDTRRTLLNIPVRKKRLADSMWTIKPNIPNRWENQNENNFIYDNIRGRNFNENIDNDLSEEGLSQTTVDSASLLSFASKTTPSVIDATTTPLNTQSDTTPLYTASPTSPITTESITTPIVTEPGEIEITTEMDLDYVNSDTLMLIRNRRGAINGGTTTTPEPFTSVAPPLCGDGAMDSPDYYVGPTGDCECGLNVTGPYCSEELSAAAQQLNRDRAVMFRTAVLGQYTDDQRADFQAQLEQAYAAAQGFDRVFFLPPEYNPETNQTTLNYYVIFDDKVDADDYSRAATVTAKIASQELPITVDAKPVSFAPDSTFLMWPPPEGPVEPVTIGPKTLDNVCYIYDRIGACQNESEPCQDRNGQPVCTATTTTPVPPICGDGATDSPDYYVGPTNDCECGLNRTGSSCSEELSAAAQQLNRDKATMFQTAALGQFTDDQRKDFQAELEKYYAAEQGFARVFVMPMEYNPETNQTTLSYYVIFDDVADADAYARSASITANIVGQILPIMVDAQPVSFAGNSTFLLRPTVDGEIIPIPIGAQTLDNVCYLYEKIGACQNGPGSCKERYSRPFCQCTKGYFGQYCTEAVRYAQEEIDDIILEVLLPILAAAAAAAAVCSGCFFFCRRCSKGGDTASTYSEESSWFESPKSVLLPRYFPTAWKQFIPGSEPEDESDTYTYSSVPVPPIIVERPIIQPVIVERVVPVFVESTAPSELSDWNSTEITSPSLILPRFHPSPFKQFIPGAQAEESD